MKKICFLIVLGCWFSLLVDNLIFVMGWIFLYGTVLYRYSKKFVWFLIWAGICLFLAVLDGQTPSPPKEGDYTIYQIKENYVFAHDRSVKVVVYGLSDAQFYDIIHLSEFEKVHSLQNISLFSFEDYLKEENIYYQANADATSLVQRQSTWKGTIYHYFSTKDPYWKMVLYGIYNDSLPELMSRLSLPILGLVMILEKRLRRWFHHRHLIYGISFLLLIVWGTLFVFTTSILRMACHRFSKILFTDWQTQFIFSCFIFFILMPEKATSFAFVLPNLMNLIYHLCPDSYCRFLMEKSVLCGLQYLYFQEVDFTILILFGVLRKGAGMFFLISWILLCFDLDLFAIWEPFLASIPKLSWTYDAGLLYILISIFILVAIYRSKKPLKKILYSFLLAGIPFALPYSDLCFRVTVFDIGQGDCTLITEPFHQSAVMIDCGQNLYRDNMEDIVLPYLRLKHIDHLDCLIITHEDFDHSGGLESLEKNIQIDKVIRLNEEKIPVKYPFYSLLADRKAKDENDQSTINYFSYDGVDYLWMGDASADVEEQLIQSYPNLKCTILKAGHHGSRTSSSFSFLDHIEPKIALISVGFENRYGHPDIEVLETMKILGISNLKTSEVGMIQIQSFHGLCIFQTGRNIFGIIQK